jgi:hypothetical protein
VASSVKQGRRTTRPKRTPAPKGHPTPGRKQRNAEARARARRRRMIVRAWWAAGALLLAGLIVLFALTGLDGAAAINASA